MTIPASLRRLTIQRANDRCEYCKIAQAGQVATFHIDHIVPVVANGETIAENLALACVSCSLRKGARQEIEDAQSGIKVLFFNPSQQSWEENFRWDGVKIIGLTPVGRAMIAALDLNREMMLSIRAEEKLLGTHPPD
jgi:HNH endonuclease